MAGQNLKWRSGALAASGFGLGMVAGLFLRKAAERTQELGRRKQAHEENERTVIYNENLPDPLERREPAPHEGQPRFGGTGAIGFSPAAATTARSRDPQGS
jgi:hypothetical protein